MTCIGVSSRRCCAPSRDELEFEVCDFPRDGLPLLRDRLASLSMLQGIQVADVALLIVGPTL